MFKILPEPQEGNIEYKQNICELTIEKLEKYSTQLKFRLNEGNGIAYYIIGIRDNGIIDGLSRCQIIESMINFDKMKNNFNGISLKYNIYNLNQNNDNYISVIKVINNNYKKDSDFII